MTQRHLDFAVFPDLQLILLKMSILSENPEVSHLSGKGLFLSTSSSESAFPGRKARLTSGLSLTFKAGVLCDGALRKDT